MRKTAIMIVFVLVAEARADEVKFFSPRIYISSLTGVSFGTPTDFRPRHAPFQIGLTLLNTKNFLIGKVAYGFVIEARDTGNSGIGHALVLSPILVKIASWDWGNSWHHRKSSLAFDMGIDHRKRFIAAFGFAF